MTTRWWALASSSIKYSQPCSWPCCEILRRDLRVPFRIYESRACGSLSALTFLLPQKEKKKDIMARSHYSPTFPALTQDPSHCVYGRRPAWRGQAHGTRVTRSTLQPAFAATTYSTLLTQVGISLLKFASQPPSCLLINQLIPSKVSSQGNADALSSDPLGVPQRKLAT